MKFGTKAIHAGLEPDPSTGAIMTPIYQTSTYVQESPGKNKGYGYARGKNPTRTALEKNIAALEEGKHGLCFSSGMGATDAVINRWDGKTYERVAKYGSIPLPDTMRPAPTRGTSSWPR